MLWERVQWGCYQSSRRRRTVYPSSKTSRTLLRSPLKISPWCWAGCERLFWKLLQEGICSVLFTVQETIAFPCQFPDQTKLYKTVLPLSQSGQLSEELTVPGQQLSPSPWPPRSWVTCSHLQSHSILILWGQVEGTFGHRMVWELGPTGVRGTGPRVWEADLVGSSLLSGSLQGNSTGGRNLLGLK